MMTATSCSTYFTDPVCAGIPDPGNPLEIKITYPAGKSIPEDEDAITVIHNGKTLALCISRPTAP
jgi:hypothetical protein